MFFEGTSKILTLNEIVKRRMNENEGIQSALYYGKGNDQLAVLDAEVVADTKGKALESIVTAKTSKWKNSEEYLRLWNEIAVIQRRWKDKIKTRVNTEQFPADYYTLIDMLRIDLTRRRIEQGDLTAIMTEEITNPNFTRTVGIREFMPYSGVMQEMDGTNESVPLIEQKTGETGSVEMALYGVGWTRSIEDEIYNTDIFQLQKVMDAVARAHTALRNNLTPLGTMIAMTTAGTWDASQQLAAQGHATDTFDYRLYLTLHMGVRKLLNLKDLQTGVTINAPRLVLAVGNAVTALDITRVIGGQLNNSKDRLVNLEKIAIDDIIVYKGDTLYYKGEKITYPGIAADKAYLFVPGSAGAPAFTLVKRQLTMEVGRGDVLQLAREKRAWYCIQTGYQEEFLGSSSAVMPDSTGYGYCIEISLPTLTEET